MNAPDWARPGRPALPARRRARRLRLFSRIVGLNIALTFAYRGEFALVQVHTLLVPLASLLVWRAALAAGARLPVDGAFLDSYFLLVSAVVVLTSSHAAFFLPDAIRNGGLNRWLIRPLSTHVDFLANNLGEKVVKIALLIPMTAVVTMVVRGRVALPGTPMRWLLFVIALVGAAALVYLMDIIASSLAFWFEDLSGILRARGAIIPALSGGVVPLALLPPAAAHAMQVQPFRYTLSFPMEVLLGTAGAAGFGWLGFWLLVTSVATAAVWRLGLRSYSAAGA